MSTLEKIRALSSFLEERHGIKLYRALSMSKVEVEKILDGKIKPTKGFLKRLTSYFGIPLHMIINDDENLPDMESIKIDEEIVSVQRNDIEHEMQREKNKHYVMRNWRLLGFGKRVALIVSTLAIVIPLLCYLIFCGYSIVSEKRGDIAKYRRDSLNTEIYDIYDENQVKYHDNLETTSRENNPNAYYVNVKVGVKLEKIKNISPASSKYEARLQLYFKFDKDDFLNMFRHYTRNVLMDQVIDDYYSLHPEEQRPKTILYNDWITGHLEYFYEWTEANDARFYPGETPADVLTEKETMFDIGNGEFVENSYGTINGLEEIQYYDENGNLRTLCYQKVKFNATFEKSFDSVRYPLESIQFKMYILPIMDADYIRYVPDNDILENGERISGFTPFFSLASGYKLLKEKDGIKNFTLRLYYYRDVNNDPAVSFDHTYKTELEIIVRANRRGISLFLQAFMNLFSVVIWIVIAFYNQSYTGEDSIGMLGTGLFGAISSALVGLSMLSDAGMFSLITMINIFTLVVIMVMAWESIAAKRAHVRHDTVQIAYNGIKLRALFITLSASTVVMFILLPLLSYLWE